MPRTHRPYPPEFRAEAVRLARGSDKSLPALAADLRISSEALRHWLRQADADEGRGQPGELTTDEREELRRLRREVKTLQQEREILRNGPEPWHTLPDEDGGILVAAVGVRGCRFSVPLSPPEIEPGRRPQHAALSP